MRSSALARQRRPRPRVPGIRPGRVVEALAEEQPPPPPAPRAHPFPTALVRGVTSGKTPYLRFDRNMVLDPAHLGPGPAHPRGRGRAPCGSCTAVRRWPPIAAAMTRTPPSRRRTTSRGLVAAKRRPAGASRAGIACAQAVRRWATLFARLAIGRSPRPPRHAAPCPCWTTYGAAELAAAVEVALARGRLRGRVRARTSWSAGGARCARLPPSRWSSPARSRAPDLDVPAHPLETYDALIPAADPPTLPDGLRALGLRRTAAELADVLPGPRATAGVPCSVLEGAGPHGAPGARRAQPGAPAHPGSPGRLQAHGRLRLGLAKGP